jgi:hypothetical protein
VCETGKPIEETRELDPAIWDDQKFAVFVIDVCRNSELCASLALIEILVAWGGREMCMIVPGKWSEWRMTTEGERSSEAWPCQDAVKAEGEKRDVCVNGLERENAADGDRIIVMQLWRNEKLTSPKLTFPLFLVPGEFAAEDGRSPSKRQS